MAVVTLEQRVFEKHGCSIAVLLQAYITEGRTSKQIADDLQCGISNVRRLARKYNIHFSSPVIRPQMMHNPAFLSQTINAANVLSRSWLNPGRTVVAEYVDPILGQHEGIYGIINSNRMLGKRIHQSV